MDEMFDDDIFEEQDMLPVLEVRILDCTKRSRIPVRRLTNFPIAETMDDKKSLCRYSCQTLPTLKIWK